MVTTEIASTPGGDTTVPGPVPELRPPGPARSRPAGVWCALAALAVPFAVVLVVALTRTWYPASDTSLIELRTWDTGGPMTPLVGPFSRLGWHHPGPLLFWVLAVPYRLFGAADRGMLVGALVVNAAAVLGALTLARRRGGTPLALLTAVAVAALVHGTGAAFLYHTWNPDLPVLPLLLLVLLTWSLVEGEAGLLPVAVVVSCFTWQSHLGYLPVAAFLSVVGATGAIVAWWRAAPARRRQLRVPFALAAGAAVVSLAPVIGEQLTTQPGNLRAIVESFRHPDGPVAGAGQGLRVAALHLSPAGAWLTGDEPTEAFSGAVLGSDPVWLLIPAFAAGVAAVAAWRVRAGAALRLLALTAAAALVGTVAAARTTGLAYPYLFNWFRPLGAALWLAIAWATFRAVTEWPVGGGERAPAGPAVRWTDRPAVRAGAVALTGVAVLGLGLASLRRGVALDLPDERQSAAIEEVLPATLAAVAGEERVYLRMEGGCGREVGDGIGLQLVKHGTDVVVPEGYAVGYGRGRIGQPTSREVRVVCGESARPVVDASPYPPVALHQVLSSAEERELADIRQGLRAQLRAAGHEDLVPMVDGELVLIVGVQGVPGVTFDPRTMARYAELFHGQLMSVAVFVEPRAT